MDRPIVAVVLAGGTGTRLYPASREDNPKQFREFAGETSLLARTVERATFADETHVLTSERFADRVREHAPDVGVLVEPASKDTGPALVYAAHRVREQVGECVLVCLPSDHSVADDEAFAATARRACRVAVETEGLVALGVRPTRPATGYGYVEPGEDRGGYHPIERFVEKPDADTAARYRDRGYLWNAGVFAWTPEALLAAARDSPLSPLVAALEGDGRDGGEPAGGDEPASSDGPADEDESVGEPTSEGKPTDEGNCADGDPEAGFAAVEPVSIDYAVMEDAENAFVVPADFAWDDLGAWDAFERLLPADEDGNTVAGNALALDASGNVLATDEASHVSVVGVSDLVVAAFDGRVLVVPKGEAQRVREVVAELREQRLF